MGSTGDDADRTAGGLLLLAFGAVHAVCTGWHLLTTGVETPVALLVGILPAFLLALLLGAIGVWLLREGPSGEDARRLVAWAVAGGLFGAISATLVVVYESGRGGALFDAPLVVGNTAAGFAVVGLLVGRYDVRARQYARRLTRYRDLFENVPVGIFRTMPGENGRFVEVNPAMVEMAGADDEADLLQRPATDIYVDHDERAAFSERLLAEGVVVEQEARFRRLNGDVFFGSVTAIKHERDGQVYFDGILEDVTERRRYQETLERHNERLGVLNDVLRHDVRNDMAVIRARAELLADRLDDEQTEADLQTLLERVDHVVDLTETARDLAEVVSTDSDSGTGVVALRPLLREEVETASGAHEAAEVTVEGEVPDVSVRANDMLASVVRNLLDNAVRHNDRDVPEVTIATEVDGAEVAIRVADNGPGIPDPQKDAIFQQGEKGEESRGTGLGLYLVETLVDQYGGRVDIADNEPRGTVFTVILPRAEADVAAVPRQD